MKMSEAAAELPCPECGAAAMRQVSGGAGLLFKGSGFYLTDYGRNAHRTSGSGPGAPAGGEGKGGESKGGEAKGGSGSGSAGGAASGSSGPASGGASGGGSGGGSSASGGSTGGTK